MEENEGRELPWVVERRMQKVPEKVKRDTLYNMLSEEFIFVCGVGGGLGTVFDGDFEGAVKRRRAVRKVFA